MKEQSGYGNERAHLAVFMLGAQRQQALGLPAGSEEHEVHGKAAA